LDNTILCNNPKLDVTLENGVRKYTFKPSFVIKNKKDLVNLIKEHQSKGLGGVLAEDVQDSMTTDEYERIFKVTITKELRLPFMGSKSLLNYDISIYLSKPKKPSDEIITIVGKGKKKVLYFNEKNPSENIQVEEDIIKYWREVPVEGLDETKIEEYLEKQGIASMKDAFASKIQTPLHKRKSHKGRQVKKHNDHLGDILTPYNPDMKK
jgi:transcription initiation factor TFIIE subunit beta